MLHEFYQQTNVENTFDEVPLVVIMNHTLLKPHGIQFGFLIYMM